MNSPSSAVLLLMVDYTYIRLKLGKVYSHYQSTVLSNFKLYTSALWRCIYILKLVNMLSVLQDRVYFCIHIIQYLLISASTHIKCIVLHLNICGCLIFISLCIICVPKVTGNIVVGRGYSNILMNINLQFVQVG